MKPWFTNKTYVERVADRKVQEKRGRLSRPLTLEPILGKGVIAEIMKVVSRYQ